MKTANTSAVVACLALSLGGCGTIFGNALGIQNSAREAAAPPTDLADYFEELLATGKAELLRNRPGRALVAFRQASYGQAHAAEAFNGMAIAYAELGREDLARRYFTQAIQVEPTDERYSRNLARLSALADTTLAEEVAPAATAPEGAAILAAENLAPAERLSPQSGAPSNMVRVSRNEVRIGAPGTILAANAASADDAIPGAIGAAAIQARGLRPRASAQPVRLVTAAVGPGARRAYPVRIELPRSN